MPTPRRLKPVSWTSALGGRSSGDEYLAGYESEDRECEAQRGVIDRYRVKVVLLGAITYGSDLLSDQPLTQ